jgi:hypothetical protein
MLVSIQVQPSAIPVLVTIKLCPWVFTRNYVVASATLWMLALPFVYPSSSYFAKPVNVTLDHTLKLISVSKFPHRWKTSSINIGKATFTSMVCLPKEKPHYRLRDSSAPTILFIYLFDQGVHVIISFFLEPSPLVILGWDLFKRGGLWHPVSLISKKPWSCARKPYWFKGN